MHDLLVFVFMLHPRGKHGYKKLNVDGSHFSNLDDLDPMRTNKDVFYSFFFKKYVAVNSHNDSTLHRHC